MPGAQGKSFRVHQFMQAINTLKLAIEDIERGYKFDDQSAVTKIQLMKDAVATVQGESKSWIEYLQAGQE